MMRLVQHGFCVDKFLSMKDKKASVKRKGRKVFGLGKIQIGCDQPTYKRTLPANVVL
jgi:hypothetical protein